MRLESTGEKQFKKVTGGIRLEATHATSEDGVRAVIQVKKKGYVPKGVKVRSKIDDKMFTADFGAGLLDALDGDAQVKSVSISQRLRIID